MGTAIPVRGQGTSKPARAALIRGKTELLSGVDIARGLDIAVRFGGDQFTVGKSKCETVALKEKNRLTCPLVPTDRALGELKGYFAKLQNSKIELLQLQWDFGANLSAREVLRAEQRLRIKTGRPNSIIAEAVFGDSEYNITHDWRDFRMS